MMIATPAARPSMLSMRLSAFVIPTSQNTVNAKLTGRHAATLKDKPAKTTPDAITSCAKSFDRARSSSRSSMRPKNQKSAAPTATAGYRPGSTITHPRAAAAAMAIPPLSGVDLRCQRSGQGSFWKGRQSENLISTQQKIVLTATVTNSAAVKAALDAWFANFIILGCRQFGL